MCIYCTCTRGRYTLLYIHHVRVTKGKNQTRSGKYERGKTRSCKLVAIKFHQTKVFTYPADKVLSLSPLLSLFPPEGADARAQETTLAVSLAVCVCVYIYIYIYVYGTVRAYCSAASGPLTSSLPSIPGALIKPTSAYIPAPFFAQAARGEICLPLREALLSRCWLSTAELYMYIYIYICV